MSLLQLLTDCLLYSGQWLSVKLIVLSQVVVLLDLLIGYLHLFDAFLDVATGQGLIFVILAEKA